MARRKHPGGRQPSARLGKHLRQQQRLPARRQRPVCQRPGDDGQPCRRQPDSATGQPRLAARPRPAPARPAAARRAGDRTAPASGRARSPVDQPQAGRVGAQAQFLSAHPQVRAAVEQAIPQLREALAEQGIALGETSVGERQQQPRDERPGTSGRGAALAGGAGEESVPGLAESAAPPAVRLEGVDLYA
ncbi:flagellar hook-length control protein FliK [Azotobacter chroococcum]